jgi:hypothetical protein
MKEFFKKNKKVLIIILITVLVIALGVGLYLFVFKDMIGGKEIDDSSDTQTTMENEETPMPEYTTESSSRIIEETYNVATDWAADVKLYDCSGIPTTFTYPDVTYEFVGADSGKYYNWNCTYYSPSKAQTKIFTYTDGKLKDSADPVDIGEYGYLIYDDVNYPSNLSDIVDSAEIYAKAVKEGLNDEANYVNMYLKDISDYGFVWEIEERSRTQKDEYDIGLIVNTYIYDIFSGELVEILQEEVY